MQFRLCGAHMSPAASDGFRAFNQPNSVCKQNNAYFAQSHLIRGIELFFKKTWVLEEAIVIGSLRLDFFFKYRSRILKPGLAVSKVSNFIPFTIPLI